MKLFEYALYKGEKLIAMGTVEEISKKTGLKESTVRFYKSKNYKKRTSEKNGKRLIKLED